jgi:hypothetical protein
MGGNKFTTDICGVDFKIRADGVWLLRNFGNEVRRGHLEDLVRRAAEAGAPSFAPGAGVWNTIAVEVAGDAVAVYVNGAKVATWSDPALQSAGRVNLGTSFDHVRFSNLRVDRVPGLSPYYDELIDDMHMVSWSDASPVLRYTGPWTHDNGQGMFTYMRTLSRARSAGAAVALTFTGTGLDLFGPSSGSALLDVVIDGGVVDGRGAAGGVGGGAVGGAADDGGVADGGGMADCGGAVRLAMPVKATNGSLRCQFQLHDLPYGEHTVVFRTANDAEFALDAIGVIGR